MDATTAVTASPAGEMARNAGEAARFLRALANESRLMVLCTLAEGECSVSGLLERVPLSQSALSQHLGVLRREGLVDTRREADPLPPSRRARAPDHARALRGVLQVDEAGDGLTKPGDRTRPSVRR